MTTTVGTVQEGVAYELTTQMLLQLAAAKIGAIHVRGFYPEDIAREAAAKAINHPALGHYHKKYTSSVGRVYMPHIDTKWDPELTAKYHDAALPSIHEVRSMFAPYLSPVDKVRLLLSELWPGGANLLRLRGRACFVGAFRVFQPTTSEFYPHNDRLDQETDAPEIEGLSEQMVANIYLQVPDDGGDLQLWRRYPTEAEKQLILEVEGLDPTTIEPPVITIHPHAGDLIIFSSAMLHGVIPAHGEHRVGMACFIGATTPDKPLFYWS
jgi:Carrier-protein-independent halogenase WelO5